MHAGSLLLKRQDYSRTERVNLINSGNGGDLKTVMKGRHDYSKIINVLRDTAANGKRLADEDQNQSLLCVTRPNNHPS